MAPTNGIRRTWGFGSPGVVDTAYENSVAYTYFDANYAAAYSPEDAPGSGVPVSQLTRQIVYVRPGYVFVYDRATTLSASYDKILRWHFQNAPKVKGNSFVETVGNSRLFGQEYSTVPIATSLTSFSVSAPFAIQQLDTENTTPTNSVNYVTVFQASPSTTTTMDPSEHIVSTGDIMEGAQIGSQVVLFGRNGPLAAGATVTYSFHGVGTVQHLLVDLVPSQTYEVNIGGTINLISTSNQGTLTFSTPGGVSSVTVVDDQLVLSSPLTTTFTAGENGTFLFMAQGFPTPSLSASGSLPTGVTFTDNGNGTATLTGMPAFGTSGTYTLTVTLHNGVVPDGTETFTLQDALTNLLMTAPAQVPSGESFSATVDLVDANGDPLTSFSGMVGLSVVGPAPGALTGDTRVPVENGVATFSNLALSTAGNYTLIVASDSDLIGSTAAVTALTDTPPTHFRVSGTPASSVAGQPFNITITPLDALNQILTGFTGTIQLATSDPQLGPVDYTFSASDNGKLTVPVMLETAGSRTITISDTARPTAQGTSSSIHVAAGSTVAGFTVRGFPLTDVMGVTHPAIVTAVDQYGNRVSSYRGQVQFAVNGGSVDLPNPYTFTAADQGRHTFIANLETVGIWSLTALDTSNSSITGAENNIDAANLTAGIIGPSAGVPDQPLSFTLSAVEDGTAPSALFQYRINWTGTGKAFQVVSGVNGMSVTHVYTAEGTFSPTVTAIDSTGNASEPSPAPQQIGIVTVDMEADPVNNSETDLVVGGTPGKDVITITPVDAEGQVLSVGVNGVVQPNDPFAPTGHILVYGDGGNDLIQLVAGTNAGQVVLIAIPALLFAGTGNCTLSSAGSSANNILVGGTGNNKLIGGMGRDILIGGSGAETLQAGSGGDLLIGGATDYDANLTSLLAISDEWQRTEITYQQRVQDLSVGGSGAANGTILLDPLTLIADNASDLLIGGSAADWFWLTDLPTSADTISGSVPGEAVTFLRG